MTAICHNLNLACEKGCLSGKSKVLKFLNNITENLRKKANDHRYNAFTKQLYDALKITGGARATNLLAYNLEGPKKSRNGKK